MYRRIIYKAGATREIINCYPRGMRQGVERIMLGKKTSEEIQEANRRQARRKLERLINANFRPGDWHITLTYRGKASPSPEAAKKELTNLLPEVWIRTEVHSRNRVCGKTYPSSHDRE